jgi:hypothetical protein
MLSSGVIASKSAAGSIRVQFMRKQYLVNLLSISGSRLTNPVLETLRLRVPRGFPLVQFVRRDVLHTGDAVW